MNFNNVGFYSREIALLFPRMVLPLSSLVVVCFARVFATRFNSDAAASSTSFAIQRLVPLLLAVTRKLIFGQCKNASRINRGRNYCVSLRAKTRYNGLLCVWTEARRGSTMGRRFCARVLAFVKIELFEIGANFGRLIDERRSHLFDNLKLLMFYFVFLSFGGLTSRNMNVDVQKYYCF